MNRRQFVRCAGGIPVAALLASCGDGTTFTSAASPKVTLAWSRATLAAIRATKPGPPMAARTLAIVHTAAYDAWAAYDPTAVGTRLGSELRQSRAQMTEANKARAISFAAYTALMDQYPSQKAAFDSLLVSLGYRVADAGTTDGNDPARIGVLAARAVLAFRESDGSNQRGSLAASGLPFADYTGYVPVNPAAIVSQATPRSAIPQPQHWQPLSYVEAAGIRTPGFLAAHWGHVTPFALASGSQFRPPAPAAFGTSAFVDQAMFVLDVQKRLTDEQKTIAEYWADGPSSELPPGHWCVFADYVAERDNLNDDQAVKLFFALANAVMDAGIATWEAKRFYDYARPITAIRYLAAGQQVTSYGPMGPAGGMMAIDGSAWRPFQPGDFITPPFPEYTSGHSAFSAASAEVLRLFTGDDSFGAKHVQPASSLRIEGGAPRAEVVLTWPTFTDAANEAGISRVYGGIHFEDGNREGLALGRKVGALVFQKARRLWEGGV